ncbi:MAG TPA: biotin/lipoyl-containing protein, partial [Gammaproteobacteria bacterium]|nr:biotin/lipoyl-containing protein [Gammaproteobacteria bacterium]
NGQPRSVKVVDRSRVAAKPIRRRAETANDRHVPAPMPGTITQILVANGEMVSRGDVLITLEAMKMETAIKADRNARIAEVIARPGELVDAKDLLIVFE